MKFKEYCLDLRLINHTKMLYNMWNCATNLPSTRSSKNVLVIKNKHSKTDCEVKCATWIPYDNYTKGRFICKDTGSHIEDILYWRDLQFIITTEEES